MPARKSIITLDGPAGSGKSTTARQLAKRLGYTYLDTGAMYRAIALMVIRNNIDPIREDQVIALLPQIQIDVRYQDDAQKTFLNGQDVSEDIRIRRIYIPSEIMKEFKYSAEMLYSGTENEDFRKMIRHLVERTRKLFTEGSEILNFTKGRLRLELKATVSGGQEILNKIEKINYNVLRRRPVLNKSDKLKIITGLIFK